MYFNEVNDIVSSGPVNIHNGYSNSYNNDSNFNNNSEDEMLDDSDNDEYNEYSGYNEYGKHDRDYYYCNRRYERRGFPLMSPIILLVTV